MLNKIDKTFIISTITTTISMLMPLLFMFIAINLSIDSKFADFLIGMTFISAVILWFLIIPVCYIIQIVTLIVKLFAKNKIKKDYILIVTNIIALILFGFIILFMTLISSTI